MSLTFTDDQIWFYLFVHEILFLSIHHVFIFNEVEVITSEEIKFIFHDPDF